MAFIPYIWNVIIPTDGLLFFRGLGQPPTHNEAMGSWQMDALKLLSQNMLEFSRGLGDILAQETVRWQRL